VTYPPYGPDTTFFPHAEHDLRDAAYLISRGVRPMALLGSCSSDEAVMGTVYTILINAAGTPLAEPFVLPSGAYPGRASYGYAARAWVTDLLEFAESDAVPLRRREEITGLLCGYSPDAIARHQERRHLVRWAPAFGGEVPDDAGAEESP
jgi:hypothetical protein